MPWRCQICDTAYDGQQGIIGPNCYKTPKCKTKGTWACVWEAPPVVQPVLDDDERAEALGYPVRYNSHGDKFPGGHKTGVMFVNSAKTRGISPDGSTHMGDREGWKGFAKTSKGWMYEGSYQRDLEPWEHRANDAQVAFPLGNA